MRRVHVTLQALLIACVSVISVETCVAQAGVIAWGNNTAGQCDVPAPPPGDEFVDIAAGSRHSLGLLKSGEIIGWGWNPWGQCDAPPPPAGKRYTAISAGWGHSLALLDDGAVVAWGFDGNGQATVPPYASGKKHIGIAAGDAFSIALEENGTVYGWGVNCCTTTGAIAIEAGPAHALVIQSNGTVQAWGDNSDGQCNAPLPPVGLAYSRVAAGQRHSLGLLSDGTVVAWGSNSVGQCDVPPLPTGLSYTKVAAGLTHSFALRSDGALVAWGSCDSLQCNLPAFPVGSQILKLSGGGDHSLAFFVGPLPWLSSSAATGAASPTTLALSGQLLDTVTGASIGGQPASIVVQTPSTIVLQPQPSAPGFADLALTNSAGTKAFPGVVELWPSLKATATGIGGTANIEMESGAIGLFVLAVGTGTLSAPLSLGPQFYYGLLLDPAMPYVVMATGATSTTGLATRQYPIPNDPALAGAAIPWQAWTTHGFFAPYTFASFTNLAVMQIP